MEPNYIYISGEEEQDDDNLRRTGKFTDADLDNLQRDLNECQKAMSQLSQSDCSGEATDFIPSIFLASDPNFHPANDSNNLELLPPQNHPAPTQFHHFTRLLHDFEEFENQMLPPTPTPSSHKDHFAANRTACTSMDHSHWLDTEIQDSRVMIEEMAADDDPGSGIFFMTNSNGPPQELNMDFEAQDVWTCYDVLFGSRIDSRPEYAADNYGCADISGSSSILQAGVYFQGASSSMTFFGCSSVRYFICSQNSSPNEFDKANRTRCKKRRYKGVVETKEETARRLERTKIRNREAAAQAHLRKLSRETHLKTLLLKLRTKNQFLKKKLMFLQDHKRTDVPPQPLRRSISGPI